MWLVQKCLVILAVEECPQQFYFPILRVVKNILDVELLFDVLKWHKDSEIKGGDRRGCLPISIDKCHYRIKCKYWGLLEIGWKDVKD